ncbi:hypothetical protein AB0C90_19830 [Streptomyces sp. NPDC048550]|uniref:hypothetical protein n=1 Tax=unclassified Streptomyces TaxID=2593676 RepID=UPI002E1162C3|nr:hypothetical protein OG299_10395 [Streptomyces sp. NBC_01296]WSW62520.1 hypothetical protein OG513_30250 [Streptomyces sp. NBC_00998]
MGTFNFNEKVTAGIIGDNGTINIGQQDTAAETLRLAAELAQWLRDQGAAQERITAAETLRGELDRAAQERRAAEPGVIRRSLETITLGLGAGSGGLALAQEISRLLGN